MHDIAKRLILLLGVLVVALPKVNAQDWDDGPTNWMVDLSAGLNTDGYEADISVSWWPVSGFGFKLALGMAGEIEPLSEWDWGYDDYYDDYYYDDNDYATRIKLMPSIILRSPSLLNFKDDEASVHIFANPGICLSPGAAGSRNAEWFSWQLRGGLELDIDDFVLQLGYGYSNFNLYSGDPYSYHGTPEERDRRTHSAFLSCGIRF